MVLGIMALVDSLAGLTYGVGTNTMTTTTLTHMVSLPICGNGNWTQL
jgi:hypothetical protein